MNATWLIDEWAAGRVRQHPDLDVAVKCQQHWEGMERLFLTEIPIITDDGTMGTMTFADAKDAVMKAIGHAKRIKGLIPFLSNHTPLRKGS